MNRRLPITAPVIVSLVALAVTAVVVLWQLPALLGAAFGAGATDDDPQRELADLVAMHDEDFEIYQDRFLGRSLFYRPAAPPPPAPKYTAPPPRQEPKPAPVVAAPEPEPTAPSTYSGPSPMFAIGDTVTFKPVRADQGELVVRVGEEKQGVRVIAMDLPWSIRVGHRGGEYDVPIFKDWKNLAPEAAPLAAAPSGSESFLIEVPDRDETTVNPERPGNLENPDGGGESPPADDGGNDPGAEEPAAPPTPAPPAPAPETGDDEPDPVPASGGNPEPVENPPS